jgi:hypothetical protein
MLCLSLHIIVPCSVINDLGRLRFLLRVDFHGDEGVAADFVSLLCGSFGYWCCVV